MRITVECGGFTRAADACLTANQTSAVLTESLAARLSWCAGMAGNDATSSDFARAYDPGAAEGLASLADLTHAFIGAGRLLDRTGDNHARAEAAAAGHPVLGYDGGSLHEGAYVRVRASPPPASLGAQEPSLGTVDRWILDQLEGFVWPSADAGLLHEAASAWRRAAASTSGLADHLDAAVTLLEQQRSPEVPLAIDALGDLTTVVGDTAWQLGTIATACEDYADAAADARDRTRALLAEVAKMVVEGAAFSAVVVGLSGGLGGGAATAAAIARVRAFAPRFYAVLAAVRTAAATAAARIERALEELTTLRERVEKFLRIPVRDDAGAATNPLGWRRSQVEQVARTIADPRRFDPSSLRGLSIDDVRTLLARWPSEASKSGDGTRFLDPDNFGRQIRVMEGYPGNRSDPLSHGPYAVVSQNGTKTKIPLKGNPVL